MGVIHVATHYRVLVTHPRLSGAVRMFDARLPPLKGDHRVGIDVSAAVGGGDQPLAYCAG